MSTWRIGSGGRGALTALKLQPGPVRTDVRGVSDVEALARKAGVARPRLADINRRRSQLWVLSLLVGLSLPGVLLVLTLGVLPPETAELVDPTYVRAGLAALLLALCAYVAERERSLRRLTTLLVDERTLNAVLTTNIGELDLLLAATRAMNASLKLDAVLDIILSAASALLGATEGTISLVRADAPDQLEVLATSGRADGRVGPRQEAGAELARRAAAAGETMLVLAPEAGHGPGTALVVPLVHRGELLGVLDLVTDRQQAAFPESQLRSVSVFAGTAAVAISNARRHGSTEASVAALTELDRMKDEFLTLVTHELRTPLTSVIGLAQTIERGAERLPPAKLAELAALIGRQGWRLDRLVDDLLRTSQLQRGQPALRPGEVDVGTLVRETVSGLQAGSATHTLVLAVPDEPAVRLLDSDAVHRIVDNLVGNALKYTPAGSTVTVTVHQEPDGVVLVVEDDGPGIPESEWGRAFEKFRRVDGGMGNGGGLGLGLYLVRALAEAHGGGAVLDRSPLGGCRFTVTLSDLDRARVAVS
jgi:signal transduction histidine kinase